MDKEVISPQQVLLLMAGYMIGTAQLFAPTATVILARQDAWLATPFALFPGLALLAALTTLNKLYPGQSLIQYSEAILGWSGKLIGLLFVWFSFHVSSLILRSTGEFLRMVVLFETPISVITILVVAVAAYALLLGFEVMTRALCLMVCLALLFIMVMEVYTIPYADFRNLTPILSNGIKPLILAGINITAFPAGEMLLFGMFIYKIESPRKAFYYLTAGTSVAALVGTMLAERVVTVLGVERTSRSAIAIVTVVGSLPGSNIMLPIMAMAWFIFTLMMFFLSYYIFVQAFAHWFKLKDYRPLVLPAGALLTVFSILLFVSTTEHSTFNMKIWPVYAIPIEFGIPFLLLAVALIRKKLKN